MTDSGRKKPSQAPSKSPAEPSSETKIAPALRLKKGGPGDERAGATSTRNGGRSRPRRVYVILRIVKSLDYWQFVFSQTRFSRLEKTLQRIL
jgi:hypothetical protein